MTDHDWAYDVEDRAQAGQVARRLLEPETSAQRFVRAMGDWGAAEQERLTGAPMQPYPLIVQHTLEESA